jgi:hypothetical protein
MGFDYKIHLVWISLSILVTNVKFLFYYNFIAFFLLLKNLYSYILDNDILHELDLPVLKMHTFNIE